MAAMGRFEQFLPLNEFMEDEYEMPTNDEQNIIVFVACNSIRPPRARINGYVNEVVVNYTDQSFQRCFRMSKTTFETIFEFMKDCPEFHVRRDHGGRQAIPIKHQLLMTLWYFGSLDTIHKIADRFGVSEYSVLSSRDKVIAASLRSLKRKFINWPDANERRVISDYFEMRNGFPGIVGCLDGTHIKISAPSDNPKSYVNRKGYHSIQLQATCRENMTFTHCFTGYPGSCHDSRILKNSDLWTNGANMCENDHIIADGGYPIQKWLLTPYRDNGHLDPYQRKFNRLLSSNRVIIERAFGLIKGRFRRLSYLSTNDIETSLDVIMTCCIFHNVCTLQNDVIEDFLQRDIDQIIINQQNNQSTTAEGVVKRDRIARVLPPWHLFQKLCT